MPEQVPELVPELMPAPVPAEEPQPTLPIPQAVTSAGDGDEGRPIEPARRPRRGHGEVGELFDARQDGEILEHLRRDAIVGIERGRGGRSVAFRVTLESGARAYFKPEQTFSGSKWYAEIVAFHLDRALGIRRTSPSTGRALPWELLAPSLEGDPRASEVIVGAGGEVRGALIAWMDERLVPIDPPEGWERSLRIDATDEPSPFVSQGLERRAREARRSGFIDAPGSPAPPLPSSGPPIAWDEEQRRIELSSLVAFDFLIQNTDRWGGGFTNVRTRGPGGPLIYLDNAAGFARSRPRVAFLDRQLGFVQRFEAGLVRRLRRLEVEELRARLEDDPLSPLLDDTQLRHLEERRVALLAHVDALLEAHGPDEVLIPPAPR